MKLYFSGKIFFYLLLIFFCAGCDRDKKNNEQIKKYEDSLAHAEAVAKDTSYKFSQTFKGTLPCTRCAGVETSVTFVMDNMTYRLKEVFKGSKEGNDEIFESHGKFVTEKGYQNNKEAVLYTIDYDKGDKKSYFLQENDSVVVKLDREKRVISNSEDYVLMRTEE